MGSAQYFGALFAAFPDFALEILDLTTSRNRTAVRWRARGTFAGPGTFQGFAPNGAQIEIEGCDVLTVADDLIQHNDAYLDSGDIARQLGFLPPAGSKAEARLTRARQRPHQACARGCTAPSRSGSPTACGSCAAASPSKTMNVYLIEDERRRDRVRRRDLGHDRRSRAAGARFGGIRRVVLGHADCDHRGAAPASARRSTAIRPSARPPSRRPDGRSATTGTLEARPARAAAAHPAAADLGRRRGADRRHGRARGTRSPASGSSSCRAMRPG